ncbi:MAG: hypothetical protein A3B95_00060 [Candidatus Doudnabacteria bacterium RIFCSPHIGHO2_02_FULL_43_13b]|nr:MAG: hypothetical protein A3B95_00060 [Candidatus Doudnabacteria bacterium RIFCSPHIGHO2_02_FULL_43_13b]
MKNKGLFFLFLIIFAFTAALVFSSNLFEPTSTAYNPNVEEKVKSSYVLLNVPFTPQAPLANWDDPRQQDGCEEASILMAWLWIQNKSIIPTEAEETIIKISEFEKERYGNFQDTSASDTAKVMKDYYGYDKLTVSENVSVEDIKNKLRQGRLVLVPANGQRLDNPNYTGDGPSTHMLVIRGFDDSKKEFITNDPGTRKGNLYAYDYDVVLGAMVNYPTGQHLSQEGRPNAMIVVEK